jgi:hypothetical protein
MKGPGGRAELRAQQVPGSHLPDKSGWRQGATPDQSDSPGLYVTEPLRLKKTMPWPAGFDWSHLSLLFGISIFVPMST